MPEASFPVEIIAGVPVVTAPDEVDVTNAAWLRAALLEAAADGNGTLVVDMSQTQFCDSAGIHVLVRAHYRARAEGGELRLVSSGTHIARLLAITGIDHVVPCFASRRQALAQPPAPSPLNRVAGTQRG